MRISEVANSCGIVVVVSRGCRHMDAQILFFLNSVLNGKNEVTKRKPTRLCHMFYGEPDLKMDVENLGTKVGPKNCLFVDDFTTPRLKHEYLRNETGSISNHPGAWVVRT